jgi:hypothetical protein
VVGSPGLPAVRTRIVLALPNKLRAMYAVARGRGVAYRVVVEDGTLFFQPGDFVSECSFRWRAPR